MTRYAITLKPCASCAHPTAVLSVANGKLTARCFACGKPITLRKERKVL